MSEYLVRLLKYRAEKLWTVLLVLGAASCRQNSPEASTGAAGVQPSAAELVVTRQYEAYNRHDLEAFVAAHAPNVRFYRYPDSLVIEGRDALRERFGKLLATAPEVHATVNARMTQGDKVVWQETATGLPGGATNTAIFVWEVHNNQITRVLMIP
jgi:hypothetical protein